MKRMKSVVILIFINAFYMKRMKSVVILIFINAFLFLI